MPANRRRFLRLAAAAAGLAATRRGRAAVAGDGPCYPVSDHCDGWRFLNPGGAAPKGLGALLRWQLGRTPGTWPDSVSVTAQPRLNPLPAPGTFKVTLVNHATFLLQFPGLTILTDPIWSERCSPVGWAGPRRIHPPGIPFTALPKVDLVLVSHNHYDHLDLPTLRRLRDEHDPRIVTLLGNGRILAEAGFGSAVELDWWESHAPRDGFQVTATPAQHFSARGLTDRMAALWGGFVIEAGGRRVCFAGDTGYFPGFKEIGTRLGPFDLALIPIGAHEPRWFMREMHCNPEEAVRIHRELGSRRSLAMHFGCFPLADDAHDQAPRELVAAREAAGMGADEFTLPEPGGTLVIG
jgi:L-ascorbate metabolism protein UlaG (beta-lactamase superfamily)